MYAPTSRVGTESSTVSHSFSSWFPLTQSLQSGMASPRATVPQEDVLYRGFYTGHSSSGYDHLLCHGRSVGCSFLCPLIHSFLTLFPPPLLALSTCSQRPHQAWQLALCWGHSVGRPGHPDIAAEPIADMKRGALLRPGNRTNAGKTVK